jgi:hypothetical protein
LTAPGRICSGNQTHARTLTTQLGFKVQELGFRVSGEMREVKVYGLGFRV